MAFPYKKELNDNQNQFIVNNKFKMKYFVLLAMTIAIVTAAPTTTPETTTEVLTTTESTSPTTSFETDQWIKQVMDMGMDLVSLPMKKDLFRELSTVEPTTSSTTTTEPITTDNKRELFLKEMELNSLLHFE